MSLQVIDFVTRVRANKSQKHSEMLKMKHSTYRMSHEKLLNDVSRGDHILKTKLELFLFHTLELRRNSKEAVKILAHFSNSTSAEVADCIFWYTKTAHKNYSPTKGRVSKYFLACISNYLESKKPTHNEIREEQNAYDFTKSLEELDGI